MRHHSSSLAVAHQEPSGAISNFQAHRDPWRLLLTEVEYRRAIERAIKEWLRSLKDRMSLHRAKYLSCCAEWYDSHLQVSGN